MGSGDESIPATPDELYDREALGSPGSQASNDSSEASTPLDGPESKDLPKRVPSLRSVSDPNNLAPSSSPLRVLANARNPRPNPPTAAASMMGGALDSDVMAKMRNFHAQRMNKAPTMNLNLPNSPSPPMGGSPAGGMAGMPPGLGRGMNRPGPGGLPKSAPDVAGVGGKKSLSERRLGGMKLPGMPGGGGSGGRPGAPKLSDLGGGGQDGGSDGQGSQMDDFKKYIDKEKGWITFDGAATITRTGVNFANGHTFSISLDEIQLLGELGKGNYGIVYKVRHAKPQMPRFGPGLTGIRHSLSYSQSDPLPLGGEPEQQADGTTGVVMAMKEIRLELDDAKFTTILKELVILHECLSPHIIEFYGAFFQEGAVYICIEYMDGGSIDKLYTGGIPENVLRKITYSTVMGLKSLKDDHNIIHRDVKPTNILVNTRGQVKICDFGVSGNLVASIAKTNIGCQSYMAPERISGGGYASAGTDGTYSVQSDIWSLGLTIIECAMGKYPYPPEVSSTIFSQLSAIVEGEPPGLPDEGYSPTAHEFVKGCLHKIPKARPTYAMLLNHPWLSQLSKPCAIQEEPEEGDAANEAAEAVSKLDLGGGTGDEEVAEWVKAVLARKQQGLTKPDSSRPALHAAPLDTASPVSSPIIGGPQ